MLTHELTDATYERLILCFDRHVQVDNESRDWQYLLALKQLGEKHGILPAFYTKTGWPQPHPGYLKDYN